MVPFPCPLSGKKKEHQLLSLFLPNQFTVALKLKGPPNRRLQVRLLLDTSHTCQKRKKALQNVSAEMGSCAVRLTDTISCCFRIKENQAPLQDIGERNNVAHYDEPVYI